ncbi:MAG: hypothetical protein ACFFDQ_13510 [Candidatus Thorarchaeota archaeon]
MSQKKQELIDIIMNENVSAIQIIGSRLGITSEEVITLINELLKTGELKGTLTDDGSRFYKSVIKLSDAPKIERDETLPSFMSFNTRPAIITSIVGILLIGGGVIVNAFARDMIESNFAAILILVGIIILMIGLYTLSKRKTPS